MKSYKQRNTSELLFPSSLSIKSSSSDPISSAKYFPLFDLFCDFGENFCTSWLILSLKSFSLSKWSVRSSFFQTLKYNWRFCQSAGRSEFWIASLIKYFMLSFSKISISSPTKPTSSAFLAYLISSGRILAQAFCRSIICAFLDLFPARLRRVLALTWTQISSSSSTEVRSSRHKSSATEIATSPKPNLFLSKYIININLDWKQQPEKIFRYYLT